MAPRHRVSSRPSVHCLPGWRGPYCATAGWTPPKHPWYGDRLTAGSVRMLQHVVSGGSQRS
jgi:hypothetical protein